MSLCSSSFASTTWTCIERTAAQLTHSALVRSVTFAAESFANPRNSRFTSNECIVVSELGQPYTSNLFCFMQRDALYKLVGYSLTLPSRHPLYYHSCTVLFCSWNGCEGCFLCREGLDWWLAVEEISCFYGKVECRGKPCSMTHPTYFISSAGK